MYNLFDVVEYKTDIKGYWLDNKGKIYIDNIRVININNDIRFDVEKHFLFNYKKQLAVFYIKDNIGYILSHNNKLTILKHNIQYKEKHINKSYIKALLLQHGGLTVFKNKTGYTISIWR